MIANPEEFVMLRRSKHQVDYLRSATDCATSEVWLEVIRKFPDMRIWVAHNKTIPIEILSLLARDPNPEVRAAVAMKNKLSYGLMELLAKDVDDSVRERVTYNEKTPSQILEQLAGDPCDRVRTQSRARLASESPKKRE